MCAELEQGKEHKNIRGSVREKGHVLVQQVLRKFRALRTASAYRFAKQDHTR